MVCSNANKLEMKALNTVVETRIKSTNVQTKIDQDNVTTRAAV